MGHPRPALDQQLEDAARDVQAAINAAATDLPAGLPTLPQARKFNPAAAPIIAAYLLSVYKTGSSIAIYIGICALIGFVATLFMTEYSHQDISEEYAHVGRR